MRVKSVGGAENHLLQLIPWLAEVGWESDLLVPSPRADHIRPLVAQFEEVCRRVAVVPMHRDVSPSLLLRLARLMRSRDYDLVHAHLVHADWHVALASVAAPRLTLVSTKHNHDRFREVAPFRLAESIAANRYDAIVAISESLREFTKRWTRLRTPLVTVRYGLEAPREPPARQTGTGTGPLLLAVARLVPQKGLDVLLEAMKEIRREVPEARLLIAGEGSERPRLEGLIDDLELGGSVELLGLRRDVTQLMRSASLLVHPARFEGFGLVLLEAMREALPIVATRVGAIPEVVVDGRTGILVPPGDAMAFAGAVLRMLRDPDSTRRMGEQGFSRLTSTFSPEQMASATAEVYDQALSGRGRTPAT
jgi:glycosyltransferase involved in cell wall biosynthesis